MLLFIFFFLVGSLLFVGCPTLQLLIIQRCAALFHPPPLNNDDDNRDLIKFVGPNIWWFMMMNDGSLQCLKLVRG